MRVGRMLRVAGALLLASALAFAQGASESLEREARAAAKAGRFRDAALKFQDAADSAVEAPRRAKMQLQAAYAHFNDKNARLAREAARRALELDAELEIVPEFFAPGFLKLVDEEKKVLRPPAPPAPIDLEDLKRTSAEKLKDGHPADVVYDLTNVPPASLDPESWRLLASAYQALGRTADAEAALRTAAENRPPVAAPLAPASAAEFVILEGRQSLMRGDLVSAQAAAQRALEEKPPGAEAFRLAGDIAAARGDVPTAELNWKEALRLEPANQAARQSLFDSAVTTRNVAEVRTIAAADPTFAARNRDRIVELARALARQGDVPRAREAFAAAAAAGPPSAALLTDWAGMLLGSGDADGALDALRKATEASPRSAAAHANLAQALKRKNALADAEREYRVSLALDDDGSSAVASLGLGALLLSQGKAALAVDHFRRASTADPRNAEAVIGLSRAQAAAGDDAGALATLEASTAEDPRVAAEAGVVAYRLGRYAAAVSAFERALARDAASAAAKKGLEESRRAQRLVERLEAQAPLQGVSSAPR